MKIPNTEVFYYWDYCYTKRNLHKVVRVNYDSYNTYVLNCYNEWEFDDNINADTLVNNMDIKILEEVTN